VIVDGLNLLHSLQHQAPHIEYLNLVDLARRLTNVRTEVLVGIQYFSAIASHISDWGQEKQKRFIESLQFDGVSVVLGHFNQDRHVCDSCGHKSNRHLEKQTDVNIATALIQGAYENAYDKVLLLTADSDLLPAIRLVKSKFPDKEIKLVSTVPYLRPVHATLGRICDGQIRLTPELVEPHLIRYEPE
jgi:uncharacterized LabA/DUF88 family protein